LSDDFAALDATAQAALVEQGELSPLELVDAAIERLERLNPQLNAVIHPALERARERAVSPELPRGSFRGVPFLMKDIGGDEAGQPYHAGMELLKRAGWRCAEDSYLTRKIEAAGLVSLGRSNTPELALLPTTEPAAYGPTRNPWSLEHSAGGSSGGAAAAVAAGIVSAAHASDGGGSIRGPASMCGLVGLKPTRGRCSFGPGLGERWNGLSCEFALTRSVRDAAGLLDVMAGAMPGDPYAAAPPERPWSQEPGRDPGRLRVGFTSQAPRNIEVEEDCAAAVEQTARLLEELGHDVSQAHPAALDEDELVGSYVKVVASNVARAVAVAEERVGRKAGDGDVEPLPAFLAETGRGIAAPELLGVLEYVHGFGRRMSSWYEGGFDLLLTPTQAKPPLRLGTLYSTIEEPLRAFFLAAPYGVFTLPLNLSGQPAVSLPLHRSQEGLPVGVQLAAACGREDLLLRVAAQLETARPWAHVRPPLFG
jgi:amidase